MKKYVAMVSLLIVFALLLFACAPEIYPVSSLSRPAYGEGERVQTLTARIEEAGEIYQVNVAVHVPEKEAEQALLQEALAEAEKAILAQFHLRKIEGDVTFPRQYGGVALRFESLSPNLMLSSGKLVGSLREQLQPICFRLRLSLGEEQRVCYFILHLKALSDCSLPTRFTAVIQGLEAGIYEGEEAVLLPQGLGEGTQVTWMVKTPDRRVGIGVLGLLAILWVLILPGQRTRERQKKEQAALMKEYPRFLGELILYLGAGASFRSALLHLQSSFSEASPMGKELELLCQDMQEGHSLREALEQWQSRSPVREIKRFCSLALQSLKEGDETLLYRLREMAQEVFEDRKKAAKKKSEEAETKLLFPMMLMLFSVLLLVLGPALLSM